jgi:hypothetical protein
MCRAQSELIAGCWRRLGQQGKNAQKWRKSQFRVTRLAVRNENLPRLVGPHSQCRSLNVNVVQMSYATSRVNFLAANRGRSSCWVRAWQPVRPMPTLIGVLSGLDCGFHRTDKSEGNHSRNSTLISHGRPALPSGSSP